MKRHALFVGVNNYVDTDIHPLKFAVNDATELAGFFKHRANFDRAEVLPDPRNLEVVLDRVHDMLDGLGAGDAFLFFFAGHGVTTQDGLRLVCAGDRLTHVKHAWAGLPLELLKDETAGIFNRLFVLDACRTDVHATNRGGAGVMGNGTRDMIMVGAGLAGAKAGSLTILCSCDDGECAGESSHFRHGLFSMALLDLLDEEERNGRRVLVTDDFAYRQLPERMCALVKVSGMESKQRPQKEGPPILILEGIAPEAQGDSFRGTRQGTGGREPDDDVRKRIGRRKNAGRTPNVILGEETEDSESNAPEIIILPSRPFDLFEYLLGQCGRSGHGTARFQRQMSQFKQLVKPVRHRKGDDYSECTVDDPHALERFFSSMPSFASIAKDRLAEHFRKALFDWLELNIGSYDKTVKTLLASLYSCITNTREDE